MSQIIKSLGAVTAIKALITPTLAFSLALSICAHLTGFQLLFLTAWNSNQIISAKQFHIVLKSLNNAQFYALESMYSHLTQHLLKSQDTQLFFTFTGCHQTIIYWKIRMRLFLFLCLFPETVMLEQYG